MARISDFHQPSTLTINSVESGAAGISSSFGPANVLRLRSDAQMWSTSGGQVSLKSLGANTILNAKELRIVQPIQVRFVSNNGDVLVPNAYSLQSATVQANTGGGGHEYPNMLEDNDRVKELNSICQRPFGWLRSVQNMVLTINGSSFQCTPDSFIDAYEALYANGRYDEAGALSAPPFNNVGAGLVFDEPGRYERCRSLVDDAKIEFLHQTANQIDDCVFQIDIVSKIPLGPLFYSCFPALENLTGNSLDSMAHVTDLSIEWTYKNDNPFVHWFAGPCLSASSALAQDVTPLPFHTFAGSRMRLQRGADAGTSGFDCQKMWDSAVSQSESIAKTATKASHFLNLQRPYLMYTVIEPSGLTPILPRYTLPGVSFVSYQKEVQIQAGAANKTTSVNWDYIKIDKLSPLVTICCVDAEKDQGTAIGARTARFKGGGGYDAVKATRWGYGYSGVTCPIDLSTLKINLSVRNQVLGSIDGSLCSEMDFYRMYLKYSKSKISFRDWKRYMKGLLVFSPMELCGVGFSNAYAPLVLSISFQVSRSYADTGLSGRAWGEQTNVAGGIEIGVDGKPVTRGAVARNIRATMTFLDEQLVSLTPGACGIEQVRFTQAEASAQFAGAQVRLDEGVLDQFTQS